MLEKVAAIIREQLNQENVEITEATRFKEDLEVDSLYNTYKNPGLPPGPISSPSLDSLQSALFPKSNPYYYFLVDLNTGQTFYAKTFEEHVQNRRLHGL